MKISSIFENGEKLASFILVATIILAMLLAAGYVSAAPQGAGITVLNSQNGTTRLADTHAAQGGSFTTLLLNATSQTSKWKAYVGNVTGSLTLDNANNRTIYDWALSNVQGEIYVSRNASVDFTSLVCANAVNVTAEENFLSINASSDDSINRTFVQRVHRSFVVGGAGTISNSTCLSIATYVNDTSQTISESSRFQELLLSDGRSMVYTTLMENDRSGFDFGTYDFQIIVPDAPDQTINELITSMQNWVRFDYFWLNFVYF